MRAGTGEASPPSGPLEPSSGPRDLDERLASLPEPLPLGKDADDEPDEAVAEGAVAPSSWRPESFAGGLFLEDLVQGCLARVSEGQSARATLSRGARELRRSHVDGRLRAEEGPEVRVRWRGEVPRAVTWVALTVALLGFGGIGAVRWHAMREETRAAGAQAAHPLHVPFFVTPETVEHGSRFAWTFDPREALTPLRRGEHLDAVVADAVSPEAAMRRLMSWTRAQWELGRPDPYPPPDATIILRDIRAGRTGGFCAQYVVVLLQAIESFGWPARCVTVTGHEVLEAWLPDERRWTMLDPTYDLQVLNPAGRSLSALEIRTAVLAGDTVRLSPGARLDESLDTYLHRFEHFGVWIRNDFVRRPMNFTDYRRYIVWYEPDGASDRHEPQRLSTPFAADLYPVRQRARRSSAQPSGRPTSPPAG